MIVSFGDRVGEALFHGRADRRTRRIGPEVRRVAERQLDMRNAAETLADLRSPPGSVDYH